MILGGVMLALGLFIVLLSAYMMSRDDTSWKWFIGIPDGLFAAYTGFAVLHYARGGRKKEQAEAGAEGESEKPKGALAALATPVTKIFGRRKNKGAETETVPAATAASVKLNKRNRRNRDPLTAADRPHALISRRLDRHGYSYYGTEPRGDGALVGPQLGLLAHDRDVDVDGRAA